MRVQAAPAEPKRFPRIRDWPLLGSAAAAQEDLLGLLARVERECGDVGGFRLGPREAVLVNSPKLVHTVLVERVHQYNKGSSLLKVFGTLFGNGLTVNRGESHRQQRELIGPSFGSRAVTSHVEAIVALTLERAALWEDGATFNLHDELGRLTMRIAGRVLFGTRFADEEALRWAVAVLARWGQYVMTHPFAPPLGVPTRTNRHAGKALRIVHQQLEPVIDARRGDESEGDDVLSHLLRARDGRGQRMSRAQLFDEMRTLGAGSVESTTDSMTWTIYLLHRHPETYERLRQEVDALGGCPPTRDDLARLPYALQVFKEALRIYPPSPVLTRAALVDTELGGYPIRKGTLVVISPYLLHRRTDVFPEPERFDPARFGPHRERALPRGAYLPFGAGIRTCIGNHFALLEGQLVLATLAQKVSFEVLPGQPIVPELNINLRPKGGLQVRVRRRDLPYRVGDSP